MRPDPSSVYQERRVLSPLTADMLQPMTAPLAAVRLEGPLTDEEYTRLSVFLRHHPQAVLVPGHIYGRELADLEFLRFFPFLKNFVVQFWSLQSLEGLRHLSGSLERLKVGASNRNLDLGVLRELRRVHTLEIEGHTKGIDVLSEMAWLEELTLRSITLPDLSLLLPLTRLVSLDIKLGGTRNLALLPQIGKLRYLELWRIRGLTDIAAVGGLAELRYLFLQALKDVTELPDLSRLGHLRRVHLETMKGLRNLQPLATAPALEQIDLVSMQHLQPDDLRPLGGLRSLKGVGIGLGSDRKNNAARALVMVPDSSSTRASWWRED